MVLVAAFGLLRAASPISASATKGKTQNSFSAMTLRSTDSTTAPIASRSDVPTQSLSSILELAIALPSAMKVGAQRPTKMPKRSACAAPLATLLGPRWRCWQSRRAGQMMFVSVFG